MSVSTITLDGDHGPITIRAAAGVPLDQALASAGHDLDRRCGGHGSCEGCRVAVTSGSVLVAGRVVGSGPVRACQARLGQGDVTIHIPERSRLTARMRVERGFTMVASPEGEPLAQGLGIAIDIGTTTVAAALVALPSGAVRADAGLLNGQCRLADDVLARIDHCAREPQRIAEYAQAVRETIGELMRELQAKTSDPIAVVTVAGNATMLHLLRGIDPSPMGVYPFTPRFQEAQTCSAGELEFPLPEATPIHLLPSIAAYIGADISAGIMALDLTRRAGTTLLVDVGTNGELVLAHDGALVAASAAAGPAFEGRGISCGMRAGPGAAVRLTGHGPEVQAATLDDAPAQGLAGSAAVDLLALGCTQGWLGPTGRAQAGGPPIITANDGARGLQLAPEVVVWERDVAALLQAKAAIAAGIATLLDHAGITAPAVDRVLVAGGFGRHLDAGNAVTCGLLPGFDPARIEAVGNSALAGAVLALMDRTALAEMSGLLGRVTVRQLDGDPVFNEHFIDALSLPTPTR